MTGPSDVSKRWGWPLKLASNFACNSVVRQVGDLEKTAEFRRCGCEAWKRGGGIACEIEMGEWYSPGFLGFVSASRVQGFRVVELCAVGDTGLE